MKSQPPRHRPFLQASAIYQIGLKPMPEAEWLDLGPDHKTFMAAKRDRLHGRPPLYYRSLPESQPAQEELRDRVVANLLVHHGEAFARRNGAICDLIDGTSHELAATGLEPLETVSNLVEEDFILFGKRDATGIMIAASNAYTSSGRIVSCVGRGMHYAHEPVPGLNDQLASRIDRVMANIQKGAPVVRFNWFITAIASRLFPVGWHDANVEASENLAAALAADHRLCGSTLCLRVERQTFLRLPETGALAFGIHTYSDPLSSVAGDRESIAALHRLVSEYAEERLRYAAMLPVRAPLLRWFEGHLG